ncbi:unnamed protein product [Thlaspi arvense]|uniref:TPX2 central domain-containing protein n=1 Tax=Thlaspi arvense TaxID=13288 RepID=A0AAU9SR44_THLAR|nr:unnamed protein product [Thlaspi arvense]
METDTDTDEEMEMEEIMVFEVSEIDLEYEFDAAQWYDFTREESSLESRQAELWFESAPSYPPSPFAIKLLLMREELSDEKMEHSSKSEDGDVTLKADVPESDSEIRQQQDLNETGNEMKSGVFNFIQGDDLKKVPNQSLHKGPTFSNRIQTDKPKCRPKTISRSSTLMKPTVSQLAKQDNARIRMPMDQTKEKGLCRSEIQASKRQKLDGGLLHKVAETTQEMDFVHKALKKEGNLQFGRTKITIPHEPDFATSHRANRIRHTTLEQDSASVYRFKARPFNPKIFEAPSLPIRKKSTPKLPEFQEFHLKTSERAMQHSSSASSGNKYHKESDKPDTTAFLDGVNREPRRPRAVDIPKEDDKKHIFKAHPHENKMLSSRRDNGIFRRSKRETRVPLEFGFRSDKRTQPDLPTDLFSKLSIKSELQPNNGSRLRFPQPEQVSKENRLNSFQAGNERTSRVMGKPTVQRGMWTNRRSIGVRRQ